MEPKKIFVLGTVGSGKSTFAKKLSKILKIKHYDLDNIFWAKKFNKKRTEKERDKLFLKICNNEKWILDGVYVDWIEMGIKKSNLVVLLKPSLSLLFWRITIRTLKRDKSKRLGKEAYKENWKDYIGLIKAARRYYKKKHTRGYYKHKELIDKHKVNFVILKTNKEINDFFDDITSIKNLF